MFKFLIYIALAYIAYATFIKPLLLPKGKDTPKKPNHPQDDADYLDYEEVKED